MADDIKTTGGDEFYWDEYGEPRPITEIETVRADEIEESEPERRPNTGFPPRTAAAFERLGTPSAQRARAVVSTDGSAKVTINSGNQKTGPTLTTHASNASCPTGRNNPSGFRCPWLGNGCYAESGRQVYITKSLNDASGFSLQRRTASLSPEDVSRSEAEALGMMYSRWQKYRVNTAVRVHVVGDCPTPESARILSDALDAYVTSLSGELTRPFHDASNIWTYTHGWRDVDRRDWHDAISVLASVDALDTEQFLREMEEAYSRGYAIASVIPTYVQREGKKLKDAIPLANGFRLLPCPYEVGAKNREGEDILCTECCYCMRETWLRKNRLVIAFAPHGTKAKQMINSLISREEFESIMA